MIKHEARGPGSAQVVRDLVLRRSGNGEPWKVREQWVGMTKWDLDRELLQSTLHYSFPLKYFLCPVSVRSPGELILLCASSSKQFIKYLRRESCRWDRPIRGGDKFSTARVDEFLSFSDWICCSNFRKRWGFLQIQRASMSAFQDSFSLICS